MHVVTAAYRTKKRVLLETTKMYGAGYSVGISKDEQYPNSLGHTLWLLQGIEMKYVTDAKAHRWLGWAQSNVFNFFESITLADLKEINEG